MVRKYLDPLVETVAAANLAVICVVSFAQVISRYFWAMSIPWATDVVRIAFVYAVFLGAAIGVRNKGHLNIDLIFQVIPEKTGKIIELVINLVIAAFLVFLIVQGWHFVVNAGTQGTPYLRLPMNRLYFAIPLSAALMLFYLAEQIMEQVRGLR